MAPVGSTFRVIGTNPSPEPAIPDSGVIRRYDFREEDGTLPITDQTGNGYDLDQGGYTGVTATINGNQAGRFDGSDGVWADFGSTLSQPIDLFVVWEWVNLPGSGTAYAVSSNDTNNRFDLFAEGGDSEWRTNAGTNLTAPNGSADTNAHLMDAHFDGANSDIREDGSSLVTGDAGSGGQESLKLGEYAGGGFHADVNIGTVWVCDADDPDYSRSEVYNHIASEWGPF